MLFYLNRKEMLQEAKCISENTGISMSKVHVLLKEQSVLEELIDSASEINAERTMGVVCSGYNGYDIETVQVGKEKKRLYQICDILYPRPEATFWNFEKRDLTEEEIPF